MTDNNHAIANARAWAASIHEAMTAYQQLDSGEAETVDYEGEAFDDPDALRQRIEEMPLSVQVRGGWYSPGDYRGQSERQAEEFEILLSTGGPALRITGDIGGAASLQWQDWGTPWTDYRDTTDGQDEAIAAFVGLFYLED
ncbi:MAG: hypothetical protein IPG83_02545 [Novosphingobium sp.]|nr:hypothetical protein [Novosphingobium sp.]